MREIELVLKAIASLGESGKEAFIWWLVASYGTLLLCFIVGSLVGLKVAKMLYESSQDTETIRRVAKVLGISKQYDQFSRNDLYEKVREMAKHLS